MSTDSTTKSSNGSARARTLAALLIGLCGCVLIWVVTPYFYYIVRLENITDSYLPAGPLFLLLLLVLGLNPVLRRYRPRWVLTNAQLVLILSMLLISCVLPIQGMMFQLPYSLASSCIRVNSEQQLAQAYADADLPPSLFPDRLGYGLPARTSEILLSELLPSERMPWGAWLGPLLSWSAFMLAFGLVMMGISLIVLPQWRHNERLAFPLLEVYEPILAPAPSDRVFAPIFRDRRFWIGAASVFGIYFLYGANAYLPENVPAIPISWNLQRCFTEEPWCYMHSSIYRNQIYFLFVGISFFMPTRISFSIWSMMIAYTGYMVVKRAYFPPFHYGTISDHRSGAILVLTLVVLWLGRARWLQVGRALVSRRCENAGDRRAGLIFVLGMAALLGWFLWVGAQLRWACFFVLTCFVVCLLITRFVAETGMPFFRIDGFNAPILMSMVPAAWVNGAAAFLTGATSMLFQMACRVNATTMAVHAFALDADGEQQPERAASRHSGRALLFIGILVLGMAVCGAATVYFSSSHTVTLDGVKNAVGATHSLNISHSMMLEQKKQHFTQPLYNRPAHLFFGAALVGVLQWACMVMPRWPLHPIGLLLVYTYYGKIAWASICLGWMVKVLVVRYGGSRLYRAAKPFFLGVIVGEVLSAVFWCIVPIVLVAFGKPYTAIRIQPP